MCVFLRLCRRDTNIRFFISLLSDFLRESVGFDRLCEVGLNNRDFLFTDWCICFLGLGSKLGGSFIGVV